MRRCYKADLACRSELGRDLLGTVSLKAGNPPLSPPSDGARSSGVVAESSGKQRLSQSQYRLDELGITGSSPVPTAHPDPRSYRHTRMVAWVESVLEAGKARAVQTR
jgi:hypothetical protein